MKKLCIHYKLDLNNWHLFGLLLSAAWLNTYLEQTGVMTREVYHNLMSDRLEVHRIDDYFNIVMRLSMWKYILMPLFLLSRLVFIALLIQFPLVLKLIDVPFNNMLRVVMLAATPLFLSQLIKSFWLLHLPVAEINRETLAYVPLAVSNIIPVRTAASNAYNILDNFNVFEFAWMIIMTRGLAASGILKKLDAFTLVLLTWMFIVLFQWALLQYLITVNG